jgi:hypothetical protein
MYVLKQRYNMGRHEKFTFSFPLNGRNNGNEHVKFWKEIDNYKLSKKTLCEG